MNKKEIRMDTVSLIVHYNILYSLFILSVRQDRMAHKLRDGNHVIFLGKAISTFVSRLVHSL